MKENTKKLPGFYIALSCCVVAIGVAGFIAENKEIKETNTPQIAEVTETPEVFIEETEIQTQTPMFTESPLPTEAAEVMEIPPYAIDNPDIIAASITVNAEESGAFCDPLNEMTTLYGFVTDTLVYNEYYGDWRTHNGVDLACELGCSVNAVADGKVVFVGDTSYGKTVKIDHGNGFVSVYACLGETSTKAGDTISQGAVIGTVSESVGENIKDPHLHFELIKDGKHVNPEEY